MSRFSLTHLSDGALLRDLAALVARDRETTAEMLSHIAEVDERKLYLPAAYPSMYAYCVAALGLSEDSAAKRIQAARVARRFPVLFEALADGRLHLSGVVLLAPHLTPQNAEDLLAAAAHRSKAAIEQLLAERFPRPDLAARLVPLAGAALLAGEVRGPLEAAGVEGPATPGVNSGNQHAPGHVRPLVAKLSPLAPARVALQVTLSQGTADKLRHAQALLSHQLPVHDLAGVLDRALDALIARLERRKFAAAARPRRSGHRLQPGSRYIPAAVKRAVWARDGGQCTFVSEIGHRCESRERLEFDHVEPFARGGRSTVEGLRLRCRAHNQYTAECEFGTGFMARKREAVRTAEARGAGTAAERPSAIRRAPSVKADAPDPSQDVIPWLRQLGIRPDEARRAIAQSGATPEATLEERVRLALRCVGPSRARGAR